MNKNELLALQIATLAVRGNLVAAAVCNELEVAFSLDETKVGEVQSNLLTKINAFYDKKE